MNKYREEALLKMICGTSDERDKALAYLYMDSGWINEAKIIFKRSGMSTEDSDDLIQEAFITFDRNLRNGTYLVELGTLKNYFLGICKNKMIMEQRRSSKASMRMDHAPELQHGETPETILLLSEEKNIIRRLLNLLNERCKELLKLYMLSYSMKEIKAEIKLDSDNAARQATFNCRKKFAELFEQRPSLKKNFKRS